MEAHDRTETEYELAAAILLLWLIFSDTRLPAQASYQAFMGGFDRLVRPTLTRIYGRARSALAESQGYSYPTRPTGGGSVTVTPGAPPTSQPSGGGEGQTILIPGLNDRINRYAEDLYETFRRRQSATSEESHRAPPQPPGEKPDTEVPPEEPKPEFTEADAARIAVTTTTQVHSDGEMDASKDVESRTGKRLVGVWRTEPGACKICSPLEGTIKEWRNQFPSGPPAHPHCILGETPVRAASLIAVTRAKYHGPVVSVKLADGSTLRVTPNHMLLTPEGFVQARCLNSGDDVLCCRPIEKSLSAVPTVSPDNEDHPATIKEIIVSLAISSGVSTSSVPASAEYLHGDAQWADGKIDVVRPDRVLRGSGLTEFFEPHLHDSLKLASPAQSFRASFRDFGAVLHALRLATDGGVGSIRELKAFRLGELRHPKHVGLTPGADGKSEQVESTNDSAATDAERLRHLENTFSASISRLQVVEINVQPHESTYVYDMETEESVYSVGPHVVSSNCRCHLEWREFLG